MKHTEFQPYPLQGNLDPMKGFLFSHQVEAVVQPDPADIAGPVDRDRHAKVVGVAAQVEIKVFRLGGDVLGQAELEAGANRPADRRLAFGSNSAAGGTNELETLLAATSPTAKPPCP